ncbi:hypothetical protein ACFFLZ_00935 [Photobacterium aphoticum]|uniref:ABC-type phosphate transport system periplasmic component n=1 Tax=Photobacterium aphoticum TaxID=754436 RepID=A0A090QKA3_9GAMM|nr:hypothetical protein [Photobacterium aphoticum]KLU99823.1 hypothetical protein ABT58_15225 [Photobacterium aphoticum]PSU59490.1 hypothetical protein C9I90_03175 [Photobacterium aphoticum]GAL03346.1 hypothetical protein JCM19237_6239 [Photobacterium aphoticum]GHA40292.1 hypothetical protein GCM10007086_12240 [Photobacterium aphoticum]
MFNGLSLLTFFPAVLIAASLMLTSTTVTASTETKKTEEVEFAVFSMNGELPPLTKSKARMLYKGKTKKINGSIKIILVDLPETSIHREEFYNMLLGKSVTQMNGYWASLSFSGKGAPPEELSSDDIKEIIEWLNANPNGIAYAPINAVPENANILITVLQGE